MKITKEQIEGFTGSAILCLLIVFILSIVFLQTEIKAQEEGILVEIETAVPDASSFEPDRAGSEPGTPAAEPVPEVQPAPAPPSSKPATSKPATSPSPAPKPQIITQTAEQTAAIEAAAKAKKEEQEKRDAINRQMSGAFGSGNPAAGSGRTASSGTATGAGGFGSFDLDGRSLRGGGLQRPAYNAQEEGSIVVEITVDPQGNVIKAVIRLRGTNIENYNLRQSSLEAAQKTKFNAISGLQNQIGTITYRYHLK
jgi:TonB family protein